LESVVIAIRTGEAVRALIDAGKADAKDYPLLLHMSDVLTRGAEVDIPWKAFETETIC